MCKFVVAACRFYHDHVSFNTSYYLSCILANLDKGHKSGFIPIGVFHKLELLQKIIVKECLTYLFKTVKILQSYVARP